MMYFSRKIKVHYWPGITCAWFILTFIITYSMSMLNGHIQEIFPFISDTGESPPESCVFGQMMNIGAVFMAITMYIRYRQVDFAINSNDISLGRGWNKLAFWSGNIVCLGVSMVGNFPKIVTVSIHFLGAFMAFGVAAVYFLVQTRISFAFKPFYDKYPEYGVGRKIIYLRLFLMISYTILFASTIACGILSNRKIKGKEFEGWTSDVDGFGIHVGATLSEWIMFIAFTAYTLTGTKEFKTMEFEEILFRRKRSNLKA